MKLTRILPMFALAALAPAMAWAGSFSAKESSATRTASFPTESPFIRYYEQRLELARSEVARARVNVEHDRERLKRGSQLYQRGLLSQEEYLELKRAFELSEAEFKTLEIKVREASIRLDWVKLLVESGQEVPFCDE